MKYWEIIANKIIKVGFSVGWISALDDMGPQFGLLTPGRRKILKVGKRSASRKARGVPSFNAGPNFSSSTSQPLRPATPLPTPADTLGARTITGIHPAARLDLP
jgi:hypothetical protein